MTTKLERKNEIAVDMADKIGELDLYMMRFEKEGVNTTTIRDALTNLLQKVRQV